MMMMMKDMGEKKEGRKAEKRIASFPGQPLVRSQSQIHQWGKTPTTITFIYITKLHSHWWKPRWITNTQIFSHIWFPWIDLHCCHRSCLRDRLIIAGCDWNLLLPFYYFHSTAVGERSIVISLSVCVSICLPVCQHISGTAGPIFTKFWVQIPCGRGSALVWQRCNM